MTNQIEFADKVALNENPNIPDINKVKADDMNEIKNKHNGVMNGSIPMGNVVVDSIRSKNMFSGVGVSGVRIDTSTGGTFANSTYSVSKYIETKSSTNYTITFTGRYCYYAWYDSTQTYISGGYLDNNTSNITIQSPANAKYIRFDFITADEGQIQIEEGSTATSYSSYQVLGYKSGSNSNGNYIKYNDGTLIQWGSKTVTTGTTSTTIGGVAIYNGNTTATFPISFLNSDISISAQIEGGSGILSWIYTISAAASATLTLQSTSSSYQRTIKWLAIGRWK